MLTATHELAEDSAAVRRLPQRHKLAAPVVHSRTSRSPASGPWPPMGRSSRAGDLLVRGAVAASSWRCGPLPPMGEEFTSFAAIHRYCTSVARKRERERERERPNLLLSVPPHLSLSLQPSLAGTFPLCLFLCPCLCICLSLTVLVFFFLQVSVSLLCQPRRRRDYLAPHLFLALSPQFL